MKSSIFIAVLFTCCCFWSAVVGEEKCTTGIPPESVSNPVLNGLYKTQVSTNVLAALRAGLLKPAKKYWNEIMCLEQDNQTGTHTELEDPTSFNTKSLRRVMTILRDYTSFYKSNAFPYYQTYRTVLDFLQATNQPEPVYAFLMNELKENDLVLDNDLAFDTVLCAKDQFGIGQDSPLLKGLPKAVIQIALQGKQIKLKNNVTGRYLMLNSDLVTNGLNTNTLSDQATNAGISNSSSSTSATIWDFKTIKMPVAAPMSYGRDPNMFTFQLSSHALCSNPALNCSAGQMLTVRGFPRRQWESEPYGAGQRFSLTSFTQFKVHVHGEDVISLELYIERMYEKHVLAELPDGSVGIVIRGYAGNTIIDGQPISGLKSYWTVEV